MIRTATARAPRLRRVFGAQVLPEADVDVVVVASGGVADVVDAAAGVAPAPAVLVRDARISTGPARSVLDLQRPCVAAEPARDAPAVGELGAVGERPGLVANRSHARPCGWSLLGFQACRSQQPAERITGPLSQPSKATDTSARPVPGRGDAAAPGRIGQGAARRAAGPGVGVEQPRRGRRRVEWRVAGSAGVGAGPVEGGLVAGGVDGGFGSGGVACVLPDEALPASEVAADRGGAAVVAPGLAGLRHAEALPVTRLQPATWQMSIASSAVAGHLPTRQGGH